MKTGEAFLNAIRNKKDARWLLIWGAALLVLAIWDLLFLNGPALKRVAAGFANTVVIALMAACVTFLLGWLCTLALHFLRLKNLRAGALLFTFLLNLFRSVPQVVGVLFCYVAVAGMIDRGVLNSPVVIFPLMALCMGLFIFAEMVDLMQERIDHFKQLDFYNAMRVCGISEGRIINFDILWKNSRIHILNKLIAVFGMAVFLQCSVDFIISVGLSTDVNSVSLPATLGSLLAKLDSKQDILAIGFTLSHPGYLPNLFFAHLQGITTAFLIVFSLFCVYQVGNGYSERHRL
jgi:ABC-type amino acid transport system permease subunit